MNNSKYAAHGLEIHFAVSNRISTRFGRDHVAHMGFSVGDTSYNAGRSEGREVEGITSDGPFIAVRSDYRHDGYIVRLGNSNNVCRYFQEFVEGYLSNTIDMHGNKIDIAHNTTTILPPKFLDVLWFVKVIRGLAEIHDIKKAPFSKEDEYKKAAKSKYSLLDSLDHFDYSKFVDATSDTEELRILKKRYPFFGKMTVGIYKKIKKMSPDEIADFIHVVTDLKSNFDNRLYATFFMQSAEFNYGSYKMIKGENCANATFFFLNHGLDYAKKKLANNAVEMKEIKELVKFVGLLEDGNRRFYMPWRSFRRARWHSPSFPNIGFLDSPDDNIYWENIKKETRITNKLKRKGLSNRKMDDLIDKLLKRTDVVCYEKQALDFVSKSRLATRDKNRFNKYSDLLAVFNVDDGGGKGTRYEAA